MEWDEYKGSNNEEHVHHAEEDGTYATQTGVHMDRCHLCLFMQLSENER